MGPAEAILPGLNGGVVIFRVAHFCSPRDGVFTRSVALVATRGIEITFSPRY